MPIPNPPLTREASSSLEQMRDYMTADIGRNYPPPAPDPSWISHIQSVLQGLNRPGGGLGLDDMVAAFPRQSSNVQQIPPGGNAATSARQVADTFKTDRMTQFDPMAAQRLEQAAQIVNALSGQG